MIAAERAFTIVVLRLNCSVYGDIIECFSDIKKSSTITNEKSFGGTNNKHKCSINFIGQRVSKWV